VPTLAALAADTSRITIGTDILNISRRHPVDVANEIATVDQISGGRVILQGAVGQPTRDWTPLGIDTPMRVRGEMLVESMEIIRALWSSEDPIDYEGTHYTLKQARLGSRPVQQPLPIWLGVAKTLKRVARYADGFTLSGSMFGSDLDSFREALEIVRQEAVVVGRDPDAIVPVARFAIAVGEDREQTKARAQADWSALWRREESWFRDQAGDPDDIAALLAPYVDAGAGHFLIWPIPYAEVGEAIRDLELFATEVIPRLRSAVIPAGGH
jgi:alkanesulfonate monooxygenase SsuD/methylene tetrahydromethanopterin reductase-like flavin-dependent oxidoreductase (luciferase family)